MSFSINGNSIPYPDTNSYSVERNDIDSSETGRLDNGYMFRECIRTGVYKVSFTWHVTGSQCNTLDNLLFQGANISLTFKDGVNWITRTMYCSKTKKDCISTGGNELWTFTANCEEV